jgi:hypothetical protein
VIREQLMKAHPERDGDFRWRGDGVSRIEGLSDAVFGFAVTLLVVSLEVPATFDDLTAMMIGLPAFAATFTLLILIWFAHYRFFRRYGLEDTRTIVLNVALLFVVLFYIYPLKFLFQTFIGLSIGLVGSRIGVAWMGPVGKASLGAIRGDQWPALMCVYAVGYVALYALFAMLHSHALSRRAELSLDDLEVLITRYAVYENLVMVAVALFSLVVLLAGILVGVPTYAVGFFAGWSYMLIWPAQVVLGRRLDREKATLRARVGPGAAAVAAAGA